MEKGVARQSKRVAFWGEESCVRIWNCERARSDSRTSEKLGVALLQGWQIGFMSCANSI